MESRCPANGGVWRTAGGWQVQVRGDIEARPALEDDFLDAEIAAIEPAGNARIQGRARGPLTQIAPHPLAPVLLARFQIVHGGDGRHRALPGFEKREGF